MLNISIENELKRQAKQSQKQPNTFMSRLNESFREKNHINLVTNNSLIKASVLNRNYNNMLDTYLFYLNYNKTNFNKLSKGKAYFF